LWSDLRHGGRRGQGFQVFDLGLEPADTASKWQDDRFLRSTWGTLVTRLAPLVTEAAVRTFGGSDFRPSELYTSDKPVTVYLRWPERSLDALAPLVRLVWDTMLGELIDWWATASPAARANTRPVLALVDEAARTPIRTCSSSHDPRQRRCSRVLPTARC
jgi:hypothetical protein